MTRMAERRKEMREMTERQRGWWKEALSDPNFEESKITCTLCKANETCPFAFDLYNYDGDCLKKKEKDMRNYHLRYPEVG